jgi:23S rRNA pseudouridine2605 synthase
MPRKKVSKRSTAAASGGSGDPPMRLQRLLASAGFGSRRQCEELIEAGRVDVDGQVVTQLGTTVQPGSQKIRVDGVPLKKQRLVYFAVNKPVGFVTTNRDPEGRPRVVDLVPPDERVFPVGRLDRSSEGLLLLTNDGELAQKLTHPKYGVRKVYRVTVAGKVDSEAMRKMQQGVHIAEGFVKVDGARVLKARNRATEMEIVLREGKNREIRRILARLGHKVQQLRRIAVGPLRLGDLPTGAYRVVTSLEVEKLYASGDSASTSEDQRPSPPRGAKKWAGRAKPAGPGRRPVKRSRRDTADPTAAAPFVLGRPRNKPGVIIGADPAPDGPSHGKPTRGTSSSRGSISRGASSAGRPSRGKSAGGKSPDGKPVRGKFARGKPAGGKSSRISSTRGGQSESRPVRSSSLPATSSANAAGEGKPASGKRVSKRRFKSESRDQFQANEGSRKPRTGVKKKRRKH